MPSDEATVDGRVLRGRRNRQAIVDALLELYHENVVDPTASEIAQRAGLSVRSVFAHFEDREALVEAVSDAQRPIFLALLEPDPPSADLGDRIRWLARARSTYFENTHPVWKAALRYVDEQPAVARRVAKDFRALRGQVESVFAPEIAGRHGDDRRLLVDALDVVFSYDVWRRLLENQCLGLECAVRVIERMAHGVLR